MKEVFKGITIFVGVIVVILALTWVLMGNEFFLYKYFAPKTENVRRQVFENTKSYKQGTIQELSNWQMEYVQADSSEKKALADIILHRMADFPLDSLPPDLHQFVDQLKRDRLSNY